ncbi:iron-containing alcohol dehydrogenase [Diplocloster modestus]|uniref:Iron-containing alcohol dehydrogenase n=1 Tax=Diplocloster modestus TaxID=2850322 RepID=A0ABS6K3L4_9FIRM|nr:iron-containing alcohol dehydrogenase [Diplocloster modestus]MBU9725122.1 iron-containing alcohol dehydrogenase [Diplocloster modestus]
MNCFSVRPNILYFDHFDEFTRKFLIGPKDLLITNQKISDTWFREKIKTAALIIPSDYSEGEPSDQMIEYIYNDILYTAYDRVIAIGGGSIMDIAKLFSLKQITPALDLFQKSVPAVRSRNLILVPTTCGTGSEITNISNLNMISLHTKLGLTDDSMYADYAVLIPELLKTLPYSYFAISSFDALCHGVESYLSPAATPFTELYSKKTIDMVLRGYMDIAAHGPDSRFQSLDNYLLAGTYGGIAISNAGCGLIHALAHPLGSQFRIPHGQAVRALFTTVLKCYEKYAPDSKLCILTGYLSDLLYCAREDALERLEALIQAVLPFQPLHTYGVRLTDLRTYAPNIQNLQQKLLKNSPYQPTLKNIDEIYRSVY